MFCVSSVYVLNDGVCVWCDAAVSGDGQAEVMKALVESLPEENYDSLRYLITFLAQVQLINYTTH